MKVLGTTTIHGRPCSFIVEMDCSEMIDITGNHRDFPEPQSIVAVSKRFRHAMNILEKSEAAKKLPSQLRTLAEMIEMSIPAITGIIEEQEVVA